MTLRSTFSLGITAADQPHPLHPQRQPMERCTPCSPGLPGEPFTIFIFLAFVPTACQNVADPADGHHFPKELIFTEPGWTELLENQLSQQTCSLDRTSRSLYRRQGSKPRRELWRSSQNPMTAKENQREFWFPVAGETPQIRADRESAHRYKLPSYLLWKVLGCAHCGWVKRALIQRTGYSLHERLETNILLRCS